MDVRSIRDCDRCALRTWACEQLVDGVRRAVREAGQRASRHGLRLPHGEVVIDCACWMRERRRLRVGGREVGD